MFWYILKKLFRLPSGRRRANFRSYPRSVDGGKGFTVRKPTLAPSASTTTSFSGTYGHTVIVGKCRVVDGDTILIGKVSLRLAGIDAPELDHPYGKQAKWFLAGLCKGQVIRAELSPELSYDRVVANCFLPDGRDLSAEMVRAGMALDWSKFSGGKYLYLEPAGIRRKHWKAAARQRGHISIFNK